MPSADTVTLTPTDALAEGSRTLAFALGNGVLFALAVDPEVAFGRTGPSEPVCFFAGGRLTDLPNGFGLSWRHDDEPDWFAPRPDQFLALRHHLLLSEATVVREAVIDDDAGRQTRWSETRFVSLAHAHLMMLRWELTPLNWSGPIVVRSQLDLQAMHAAPHPAWAHGGEPRAVNNLMPADGLAAQVSGPADAPPLRVDVTLRTSGAPSRQAGRAHAPELSYQQRQVEVPPDATVVIDVVVTVVPDDGQTPPAPPVFDPERERHRVTWRSVWDRVQVAVPGAPALERALRFNAFQLLQAVSPLSVGRDVGLPEWSAPKGPPGHEAWDEAMAMPFYSLHLPALARELIHHRARRMAPGTPGPWFTAAVLAVRNHHAATQDTALLAGPAGDLLVTCARHWATQDPAGEALLGAWTLRTAADLIDRLDARARAALAARHDLAEGEVAAWDTLSRTPGVPWRGEVLALPDGHGVDTLTWLSLLGPEEAEALLVHRGERPPEGWYARTVRHHLEGLPAATGVERVVRAGVLAAVDPEASWTLFVEAAQALLDEPVPLDDGLSFGAMGGVWDVLLRHYLGVRPAPDGLRLSPRPPPGLDGIAVRVLLSGHWVTVRLQGPLLMLQTPQGTPPLVLRHGGAVHELPADTAWAVRCR